jgi:hypothetical protein
VTAVPTGFEPATSALTGPLIPARLAVTHLHDSWESVKKAQLSARSRTALRACYHTVCTALPRCLQTRNAAVVLPARALDRLSAGELHRLARLLAAAFLADLRPAPPSAAVSACPGCHMAWWRMSTAQLPVAGQGASEPALFGAARRPTAALAAGPPARP